MKQTIDITAPAIAVVSSNDRTHWATTGSRTRQLRTLGWAVGRRGLTPVPDGELVVIDVHVWKGYGSHYDPANLYPSAKAIVDGFRDAGILVDDDWSRVDGPHLHHGGVKKSLSRGRGRRGGHVLFSVTLATAGGA